MSPLYFNPRVDFAFKRVFGSIKNEDVLISFLDAVLYNGDGRIQSVQILNPYVPGETHVEKETHVDVRAKLDNGREVLVEMQMVNVVNFPQRVLYNAAKVYGGQLGRGENYQDVHAVIGLTITNFKLFNDDTRWRTQFVMREATSGMNYPGDNNIELVFVELPKFDVKQADMGRKEDRWVLFLKEGEMLDQQTRDYLMADPVIQRAYKNLELAEMNGADRLELEGREIWLRDRISERLYERKEGRAEGRAEGRSEALTQTALRQLTRRLGVLPPPLQIRITVLKLQQLEQLMDALLDFVTLTDLQVWLDEISMENKSKTMFM